MRLSKQLLSNTDNEAVKEAAKSNFINYLPNHLETALKRITSERFQWYMNLLDYFDYHFRAYVCGKCKTTHRVYSELRHGLNEGMKKQLFEYVMSAIENQINSNELYEYMPRFLSLKSKCEKIISKHEYQ